MKQMKKRLLFKSTLVLVSIALLVSKIILMTSSEFRSRGYIDYERRMIEEGKMNWQESECFIMKDGKLTIK